RLRGRHAVRGVDGARQAPGRAHRRRHRQVQADRQEPARRAGARDRARGARPAEACIMEQLVIKKDFRVRRTELTCPAHSLKMMSKAPASHADDVMLDLEARCAVSQEVAARGTLIEALRTLDFGGKVRAFRPNNIRTKFFYRDLIEVVEAAGANVDVVVVPKVYGPEDVQFVDRLLTQ